MQELPKYTVYRCKRKSIRIVLRANGTFAVYCPKRCPTKDIEEILSKHALLMKEHFNAKSDALFTDGSGSQTLPWLGKRYPLALTDKKRFSFDGSRFLTPTDNKEEIRILYRELLRKKSKELIPIIATEIAQKHSLSFSGLTVKAIYSRYGSCSSKKHLNFSLALAAFDTEFIRFVVSHELCHTVFMNHSTDFYALLDKVYPDHRKVKNEGAAERSVILKAIHFSPA